MAGANIVELKQLGFTASTTLTYTFLTKHAYYVPDGKYGPMQAFSGAQQEAIKAIFDEISSVTGLTFVPVTQDNDKSIVGDIAFGRRVLPLSSDGFTVNGTANTNPITPEYQDVWLNSDIGCEYGDHARRLQHDYAQ